eukprot:COSAG01_NODE_55457_length_325_cov_0.469027_1_plen_55_part_01
MHTPRYAQRACIAVLHALKYTIVQAYLSCPETSVQQLPGYVASGKPKFATLSKAP